MCTEKHGAACFVSVIAFNPHNDLVRYRSSSTGLTGDEMREGGFIDLPIVTYLGMGQGSSF